MWLIYKTVEPLTGRYYIGKSYALQIERGYKGSGVWPTNAHRKGRLLETTVLLRFDTEMEAYDAEHFFVVCHKDDPLCMNIADGGIDGTGVVNRGKVPTAEHREKIRAKAQARWDDPAYKAKHWLGTKSALNAGYAKFMTSEERARRAERARLQHAEGRMKITDAMRAKMSASQTGRKHSPETIAKMKLAQQARRAQHG